MLTLIAGIVLSVAACARAADSVRTTSASVLVAASDTLAGPLPRILYADRSPYFVLSDISVSQGQTVIIEPGTVLLFSAFTTLKVQGTLLARGESDKPIIFTSVNDQAHNPLSQLKGAAYDWNGIQVAQDGIGTHFAYCAIRYSVFGIVSMTRYIRIGPSLFQSNGRANLTIEGVEHQTGETPYEYNATEVKPTGSDSLVILKDPNLRKRTIIRYSSLGVLLAGAVMSAVYTAHFSDSDDRLDQLSSRDPSNLAGHTGDEWSVAEDDARHDRAGMVFGYLIATVGAVGFGWTFFF